MKRTTVANPAKPEDSKIRVLLVAPDLPFLGGQTVQAMRLLEGLRDEHELEVAFQAINPPFFPRLQRIKYLRTALMLCRYVFELFRRVPRYDIIHIFSASYLSFLISPTPAILIAKLFGKVTILNYRSGEAADHLRRWRSAIPTIRLCERIVVPSGYLVDVFREFDLSAVSIANSVDTKRFRRRSRATFRPIFLSNRNFEPHYNVACTLKAFSLIQERFPEASLIVVGDGPEKKMLTNLAKELGLRNTDFLGSVDIGQMPDVYNKADIFLNSPNLDNMPNSIIEAFACGLAVVSTNAGGIPYIVETGRNGLLTEVNDPEDLAANAIRLVEDADLAKRLTDTAFADLHKYSWKSVRNQWLEIYKELASRAQVQA